MPKDRDQLTPDEPEDAGRLGPKRSADREASAGAEPAGFAGHGPASAGADPPARDEVTTEEKANYR